MASGAETMTSYAVHTRETAPAASQALLEGVRRANGFVPNILAIFAEEPAVLRGYLSMSEAFDSSSLDNRERQIVQLAAGVANRCHYCVAAHSTIAPHAGVGESTIAAIRAGEIPSDARDAALAQLTRALVEKRGFLSEANQEAFFAVGYGKAQLLAVVFGVAMKTLTNYVNHIAETPLDPPFRARAFQSPIEVV